MGHDWREGRCRGCTKTMAQVASVKCAAGPCDEDRKGLELLVADAHRDVGVDAAARALVIALRKAVIPGNATAELSNLARTLGMP